MKGERRSTLPTPVSFSPRSQPRPSPRFYRWVRAYGLNRLARTLRISRGTPYRWLNRENKYLVRPYLGWAVLRLSAQEHRGIGPLGWADLYGNPQRP